MKPGTRKNFLFFGLLSVIFLGTIALFDLIVLSKRNISPEANLSPSPNESIEPSAEPSPEPDEEVVIVGVVDWIALSARTVHLEKSVNGVEVIALDDKTKILNQRGKAIELKDIEEKVGVKIKATGSFGTLEALLAKEIIVYID